MEEYKNVKKIEDYQLEELHKGVLLISKSDMSLKYVYELEPIWKQYFFDILAEEAESPYCGAMMISTGNLFKHMKEEYSTRLRIDTKYSLTYIDLIDYITFEEWLKIKGNGYGFGINDHGVYLISQN